MPQSRSNQRQPARRSPPPLDELRDPSEGSPPAIRSNLARYEGDADDPQQAAAALYPQFIPPPCYTIGDEQRDRAAEVEEIGIVQWIDDHDSRTDEEKAEGQLQVAGVRGDNAQVVKTGGGQFPRDYTA